MSETILNPTRRVKEFFASSIRGFALVWGSARRLTLINLLLFVLLAIIPLLSFMVLKELIDRVIKEGAISWDWSGIYLVQFGLLQLANIVITQFSSYYMLLQQQVISDDIAVQVLNKAVQLDLEYYENPGFYDDLHMAQQQSLHRPAQLISTAQTIIQNIITIILFAGFLFLVHWAVPVLLVALSIPLAVSKVLHGYQQFLLEKNTVPVQRKAGSLFSYLTTDTHAKEVRVFNFGKEFINQFIHLRQFIFAKKKQLHYKFLKQSIFIQFFEVAFTILIYCILIMSAVAGTITIGGLVIYFQVFQRLQASINNLFQAGINLFQNHLYLKQILDYLDAATIVKDSNEARPMPALSQSIRVKNLSFTYPQTDKQILHDVSMELKPGTITAIVGENGSGKSTLIKLLCRLYDVPRGAISIDGTDLLDIAQDDWRANITAIFQDFGKYYLTVEDNIALGENRRDEAAMDAAASRSGIYSFIQKLPAKYKTMLGRTFKNGVQLSGGQWQKMALARGFYKNSRIIILDEPTSAMDPIAEYGVFQTLKEELNDKIVVLITHRLYNLKLADNIYVFDDGRVVEQGRFDQLLERKAVFSTIYEKQAI